MARCSRGLGGWVPGTTGHNTRAHSIPHLVRAPCLHAFLGFPRRGAAVVPRRGLATIVECLWPGQVVVDVMIVVVRVVAAILKVVVTATTAAENSGSSTAPRPPP
jgi:hypothetical protein